MTEQKQPEMVGHGTLLIPIAIVGFVCMLLAAAVARATRSPVLTKLTLAPATLLMSNFLLAGPLIALVFLTSVNPEVIVELTLLKQLWLPLAASFANLFLSAPVNLPFFSPLTAVLLPVVLLAQVVWWFLVGRFINNVMFWVIWPQDR